MKPIGDTKPKREFTAVANGAITAGDPCIIESAGTVAAVDETSVSQSVGPENSYNNNGSYGCTVYDPDQDKVVHFFKDPTNSNYGAGIVGTVSGTTITYGTKTVFNSDTVNYIDATYNENDQKHVVVFSDSSYNGDAVVATVSGTSVSFGTVAQYRAATCLYSAVEFSDLNNNVLITYQLESDSSRRGRVGNISGTSISFGTEATIDSNGGAWGGSVYDSNAQKVVAIWSDNGTSDRGKAKVITVGSTTLSQGSEATFETGGVDEMSAAFDSTNNKVVIFYEDSSNSNSGTAVVGTVSGTSISFGTPVVFQSGASGAALPLRDNSSAAFDPFTGKVNCVYKDGSNSSYGTVATGTVSGTSITFETGFAFTSSATTYGSLVKINGATDSKFVAVDGNGADAYVYQNGYTEQNLTAENFIGFADNDFADGADATVALSGSITRDQTGLTAGQKYYVQNDGSLDTTADDPSVVAGTAISATELIIKG